MSKWDKIFSRAPKIPHTEAIADPISVPVTTAVIGLHQKAQPPPAEELTRYNPNPATAPIAAPIITFIPEPLCAELIMITINPREHLSSS
jgi:hypothetical protein